MPTISPNITLECPECGEELDAEIEITVTYDRHPYGSTFATEENCETEVIDAKCPGCGKNCSELASEAAEQVDVYDYLD